MKNYDYLLSEVPSTSDTLLHKPRFFSITDLFKVYRFVIRSANLYCAFVEYQNKYKRYPSPEWLQSEALFELTHVQPSLF